MAAAQRLETALFLFDQSTHYRDAVYLAGYSVECALKALILQRTPRRSFKAMYEKLTQGKKAHDFEFLKGILQRAPVNFVIPVDTAEWLLRVNSWSTDLRYEVGLSPYDEARDFIEATQQICEWVERNLK